MIKYLLRSTTDIEWSFSKADTIGTATVCPYYGGICISGASGILLVGMVMCTQAGEYNEAAFSDLSIAIRG